MKGCGSMPIRRRFTHLPVPMGEMGYRAKMRVSAVQICRHSNAHVDIMSNHIDASLSPP
jgi:hypothetical protein